MCSTKKIINNHQVIHHQPVNRVNIRI